MFCFRCKVGKPKVEMKQTGTTVTVLQHCKHCEGKPYTWRSQPYHPVLGRYPVGNVLLSFAVLFAGASYLQGPFGVPAYGPLNLQHPYLLFTSEEVCFPRHSLSLGDIPG